MLGSMAYRVRNRVVPQSLRDFWELRRWERAGQPAPPPGVVKQRTIKAYARRFQIDTLIETGTYLGAMIAATKQTFAQLYTIELDQRLYERAKRRFAGDSHVHVLHGDSATMLPTVLATLTRPAIFWLDGHYSAGFTAKGALDTPILAELQSIVDHPVAGHVIIIDDARCFTGQGDYPTVDAVRTFVAARKPAWAFEVHNDSIRITPERTPVE